MRILNGDYLSRAWLAFLSSLASSLTTFVVLVIARTEYAPDVIVTIGSVGAISGIVATVSAGFTVHTVMSCSQHLRRGTKLTAGSSEHLSAQGKVKAELRSGLGLTAVIALLVLVCSLFGAAFFGLQAENFYPYWFAVVPSILLGPLAAISTGVVQAAGYDRLVLATSLGAAAVNIAAASACVLFGVAPKVALLIIGATNSLAVITRLIVEVTAQRKMGLSVVHLALQVAKPGYASGNVRSFSFAPQFMATVDGFVFMATFTLAISVASGYSTADGATVATLVALMRMLIVPVKQLGLIGGRMSKQGVLSQPPTESPQRQAHPLKHRDLATVAASSLVITASLSAVVVVLFLINALHIQPAVLIALIVAQLLSEPVCGVLFSFLKVVAGPKQGIPGLLIAYLVFGVAGLCTLGLLGIATALNVWLVLLSARAVFAAFTVASALRWSRGKA